MVLDKHVGFIGAGQMAEALARGFSDKGMVPADHMHCTDPSKQRRDLFEELGAHAYEKAAQVAEKSDVIFIAVKPQYVGTVLKEMKGQLKKETIIVSIAAGVPLAAMKEAVGGEVKLIRVMPNTPCLVGETASAMCLGGSATEDDAEVVRSLFSSVGTIFKVDEKLLSAVTGLSGSGPAYIFVMIEALADGGVLAGLPRDVAQQLAAQTVLGSAKMVIQTGKHPGALKDMVTSPAGTTIAGVHELEKAGVRNAFINAVLAASNRADELSKL